MNSNHCQGTGQGTGTCAPLNDEVIKQLKDAETLAYSPSPLKGWEGEHIGMWTLPDGSQKPINMRTPPDPVYGTHGTYGALDTQVGGGHYKDMKIQPITFIVENDIPYREGNAIKYICRHKNKNGVEDIKKAIHYLEMIKEEYENVQKESE